MIFHAFVRPVIRQLSGEVARTDLEREGLAATLSRNVASAPGREDLVRVALEEGGNGRRRPSFDGKFRDDIHHDEGGRLHRDFRWKPRGCARERRCACTSIECGCRPFIFIESGVDV